MKFLTDAPITKLDRATKVKLIAFAPTNDLRYKLLDLGAGDSESLAKRVEMAEFVFTTCIKELFVAGAKIEPSDMVKADIQDEKTATVYFTCVNLVVEAYLADTTEAEEVKK